MSELITAKEAQKLSGYTPEHITRLVRAGKVKGQRFGLMWQVDKESLLEYVEQARQNSDGRFGPQR